MADFNTFVQTELPKRPFVNGDGTPGYVLTRSTQVGAGPLQLDWIDPLTLVTSTNLALNDLSDVVSTAPTDGQVLTWNAGSARWVPGAVIPSGGGAVTSVNGQAGTVVVSTDNIPQGSSNLYFTQALFNIYFDSRFSATSITSLVDVDTTVGAVDGQALAWSSILSQWIPTNIPGSVLSVNGKIGTVVLDTGDVDEGSNLYFTAARVTSVLNASQLDELADVEYGKVLPIQAGHVLFFDGNDWTNEILPPAPVVSVNGLTGAVALTTDDITDTANARYLTTSSFISFLGARSIDDLGDVDTDTSPPVIGNALTWDGSNWVPSTPPGAPVTSVNGQTAVVVLDTDDIAEAGNLYYTSVRATAQALNTIRSSSVKELGDVDNLMNPVDGDTLIWNSLFNHWTSDAPPTIRVTSVNSQTGAVLLNTEDVGESGLNQYLTPNRFLTLFVARSIDDLADVDTSTANTNDVLVYDGSTWVASLPPSAPVTSVAGKTGVVSLDTSDVAEGSHLYYTSARGLNAVRSATLGDLSDINVSGVVDGQYLAFVGGFTNEWRPTTAPTAPVTSVAGRTGAITLTTSDIAEGSNLYFSQARLASGLNSSFIDDFADVTITSVQTGHTLKWNGLNWVNDFASVTSSAVIVGLGYTPANRAGDTFTGTISAPDVTATTMSTSLWNATDYDIGMSYASVAPAGIVSLFTCTRPFSLPIGLTGSQARATIAAALSTVFTIQKRTAAGATTSTGTITFAGSATSGTFSFTSAVSFAVGDMLLINLASADATLANVGFTFAGTLV